MRGMLKLSTALGAMNLLAGQRSVEVARSFGITKEDVDLCCGNAVWTGSDRERIRKVLDVFACGVMDIVGVPRFEMPAEYYAAVIAMFVSPTNVMVACRWAESHRPAQALWGSSMASDSQVDPAEVFALVCTLLHEAGVSELRSQFEKRVGVAIGKATGKEKVDA